MTARLLLPLLLALLGGHLVAANTSREAKWYVVAAAILALYLGGYLRAEWT